jgi:hypothetical protein
MRAARTFRSFATVAMTALLLPFTVPAHAAESRMTGRVLDADTQRPIAGADVELANAGGGQGYFRGSTDAKGEFHLERLTAERYYTLTVSAAGYADFVLGSWQFPSAQRAVDVVVPLDRAGAIEFRVTAGDGRTPLPGARVSTRTERAAQWWQGYRPPPAPLFTDNRGIARFQDLQAGTWSASVESEGLLGWEGQNLSVRRGESTRVEVRLVKPARLSGTVRLADSTGVANVSVVARGPAEGVGTSGPDGLFSIEDLPPGRYRVMVTQEGLAPTVAREEIVLAEGGARAGIQITATPRPPELALVLQREAFTPDEKVTLALRSFRVGVVDLALYQIPALRLRDAAHDFRTLGQNRDTTGLIAVRRWQKQTADGPPYTWREEELTLPAQDMIPGAYLLRAGSGDLQRGVIFFVTDLGLIVKRSSERLLVSAARLKDGTPVADAQVSIVATGQNPAEPFPWQRALATAAITAGKCDANGLLMLPLKGAGDRVRVVASSEAHGLAVADAPLAAVASQGGDRVFLYTERPIYRPGQTVYWKALVRRDAAAGYTLPGVTNATLTLNGPEGAGVAVPAARLSAHGSADGAIVLPKDLVLGDWNLSARVGLAAATAVFAVQEYRKPEYQVEVTPDRDVYVNGDEVRFKVAATYFFGAPVFGATVRYNLFESRLQTEAWSSEDEGDGEGYSSGSGYGRVLKTGEARTDADGRVALTFVPGPVTYDRRLTVEVEVVDGARRMVSGRGSTVMGRGLFTLAVKPLDRVVGVGQPIRLEVTARDHAGKPVAVAATVTFDQEAWNPLERRYTRSTRPLAEAPATTGANGIANLSLVPTPVRSGNLIVRVRAEDARGNRITAESSVWVYDARVVDYAYRYSTLEAFADRERYQPGDTAKILINTDVRGARVLVAVEGRELYDARILPLGGNTGLVTVPLTAEYAPNVFVAIHVRKGRDLQSRVIELPVRAERHDLVIALKPDRDRYRPRERANVAIETRDSRGAPVAAELSLGVVDEAIYALKADATPDPHDVFYGRRPDWVTTAVSFPIHYYGGADKGGREEPRKDFRDVAFWAPSVTTDSSGRAQVGFDWPDNLTTWRLTSRGATDGTLVGRAVAKTLVTKDVVARLALPRQFVAGDGAELVSVVTNRTSAPLVGVNEAITASGLAKLAGAVARTTDIPAAGESRGGWRVSIARELPADGDSARARFLFRARSKTDADALELVTPVRAKAVALRPHAAGVLTEPRAALTVALPDDLVRPGSSLALEFSPSAAAMCLGAVDWLVVCPWACTEQTSNAILPACALLAAARKAGVQVPGWADPAARLAPSLDHLAALQAPDGGWGWWQGNESDPYLSALAIDALAGAVALGVANPAAETALNRAQGNVMMLLAATRSRDGEAYVLAHLSPLLTLENTEGRFPGLKDRLGELATSVYTARAELGTAALALAVTGDVALGRAEEAKALFAMLEKRAQKDGAGLSWPGDDTYDWFGEGHENTGYALAAMLALDPRDPRAAEVVRWLAARRRGPYWRCTRSTGPVAIALARYLEAHAAEMRPDMRLRVEWNGAPVLEQPLTAADVFGVAALRVAIPGARLKPGANALAVAREGTGTLYWSWEARALVPSPGPSTEAEKRLAVRREYLHVERTADRRGRPQYLTSPLERPRVSEAVMVRLTLRAPAALSWLILEDPLPAGFEVDALLPEGAEWPWTTHAETRDDRAVFFLDHLEAGETVLEYLVRPEMAGTFCALPASAGAMYDPDLLVRSAGLELTVVP